MNTVSIYVLIDPRNGDIRYVGKANDVQRRMYVHLADVTNTHKSLWIQSLRALGLKPDVKVIQILTDPTLEEWQKAESYWIAHYRNEGFDLTNLTDGGEGGPKGPKSGLTKWRISQSKIGTLNASALLTEEIVLDIRNCAAKGISNFELAERFNVKKSTISAIVTGRSWSRVGGPRSKLRGPQSQSRAAILRDL